MKMWKYFYDQHIKRKTFGFEERYGNLKILYKNSKRKKFSYEKGYKIVDIFQKKKKKE